MSIELETLLRNVMWLMRAPMKERLIFPESGNHDCAAIVGNNLLYDGTIPWPVSPTQKIEETGNGCRYSPAADSCAELYFQWI
jgi:hypothetical protein